MLCYLPDGHPPIVWAGFQLPVVVVSCQNRGEESCISAEVHRLPGSQNKRPPCVFFRLFCVHSAEATGPPRHGLCSHSSLLLVPDPHLQQL